MRISLIAGISLSFLFYLFYFISFAIPKYNNYNNYNHYHKAYMHTPKHTCNSTITHKVMPTVIYKCYSKKKKLIIFVKEKN